MSGSGDPPTHAPTVDLGRCSTKRPLGGRGRVATTVQPLHTKEVSKSVDPSSEPHEEQRQWMHSLKNMQKTRKPCSLQPQHSLVRARLGHPDVYSKDSGHTYETNVAISSDLTAHGRSISLSLIGRLGRSLKRLRQPRRDKNEIDLSSQTCYPQRRMYLSRQQSNTSTTNPQHLSVDVHARSGSGNLPRNSVKAVGSPRRPPAVQHTLISP